MPQRTPVGEVRHPQPAQSYEAGACALKQLFLQE
jgi:hypothetical protein